jgi:hypothetical protein
MAWVQNNSLQHANWTLPVYRPDGMAGKEVFSSNRELGGIPPG